MMPSDDRNESEAERDDRNLMELLQELRVAGIGVQVLFGFLLSLPFTNGFAKLSHAQRGLFIADLVLSAVATVLLVGPVAYHRLVFRHHLKKPLIMVANKMAIAGLAAVALAVMIGVTLVTSFVEGNTSAIIIGIFFACLFAVLWFVLPLVRRHRPDSAH
jgi:nicotinamide riboside transporter PnuC